MDRPLYYLLEIVILISLLLIFSMTAIASDGVILGKVECFVQYNNTEKTFRYSYKVINNSGNTKDIWTFDVQYQAPVVELVSPNDWEADFFKEKPIVDWTSIYKNLWIKPGSVLGGFELKSKGIPGFTDYYVQGWTPPPPPVPEGQAEEEMAVGFLENSIKGKTIGPTAPPPVFKPIEFLDNIINMKHEAYNLGWIKNQGILQSLDAKLDNAKKKLENGDTKAAKNILSAFINEVEAQGCASYENCPQGKHLTSEAYGLLKYNAVASRIIPAKVL